MTFPVYSLQVAEAVTYVLRMPLYVDEAVTGRLLCVCTDGGDGLDVSVRSAVGVDLLLLHQM